MEFSHPPLPEIKNTFKDVGELAAFLDAHSIAHSEWNGQKTLTDLLGELSSGESKLVVDKNGELRRHTAVAWVEVISINKQGQRVRLREVRQVFKDGKGTRTRTNLPASLGEKIYVYGSKREAPSAGAERALAEELGISQDTDKIQFEKFTTREMEASSYPGLLTVYTDYFFTTEVPYKEEGYVELQESKTTYFEWELIEETS